MGEQKTGKEGIEDKVKSEFSYPLNQHCDFCYERAEKVTDLSNFPGYTSFFDNHAKKLACDECSEQKMYSAFDAFFNNIIVKNRGQDPMKLSETEWSTIDSCINGLNAVLRRLPKKPDEGGYKNPIISPYHHTIVYSRVNPIAEEKDLKSLLDRLNMLKEEYGMLKEQRRYLEFKEFFDDAIVKGREQDPMKMDESEWQRVDHCVNGLKTILHGLQEGKYRNPIISPYALKGSRHAIDPIASEKDLVSLLKEFIVLKEQKNYLYAVSGDPAKE